MKMRRRRRNILDRWIAARELRRRPGRMDVYCTLAPAGWTVQVGNVLFILDRKIWVGKRH